MGTSGIRTKAGLAVAIAALALPAGASGATLYGLTVNNQLFTFSSENPGSPSAVTPITGIDAGNSMEAIDFRPANGRLYGLAHDLGGMARIYVIDQATGAATRVGGQFPLSGANGYSIDFNPVVDRLRVVTSSQKQNLRVNPNDGSVLTDANLSRAPGDPKAAVDPAVSGVAYTNNFPGAPATTLFGWDWMGDFLVRQGGPDGSPSPDTGLLFFIGEDPSIVSAGESQIGLDIAPDGVAYLVYTEGDSRLRTVDLSNGSLGPVQVFGPPIGSGIRDVAAPPVANGFSFSTGSFSATEGQGAVTITVQRSNTIGTASVAFATANGSASFGDYTPKSGTLDFAAGEATKSFDVPIANDSDDEPGESVILSLANPVGGAASLVDPATAVLTIENNAVPAVQKAKATHDVFTVGRKQTPVTLAKRDKGPPVGTTFKYTLSEPGTVRIGIERKKTKRGFKEVGALTRDATAGKNKTKFSGRIGKRALKPGKYRARFSTTDATGLESVDRLVKFRVVKG